MKRITSAYRQGKVYLVLRMKEKWRPSRRIRGQVVDVQKHFVVVQTPYYRECVGENDFLTGHAEIIEMKVLWGDVA